MLTKYFTGGFTFIELLISMTLGLVILQILTSFYYHLERVHLNIIQMEYQFDQSSYIFYWMNHYSRLAGYHVHYPLGLKGLPNAFTDKLKKIIHYKPNSWIAFRFRLPNTDQYMKVYSCEGSLLQWANDVAVTEEILVVFWFSETSGTLKCKTWVNHEKKQRWCELPIDTGMCTQFRVNSQSLLKDIHSLKFELNASYFDVIMFLKDQYPSQFNHYRSRWTVLNSQRLYPFQQ